MHCQQLLESHLTPCCCETFTCSAIVMHSNSAVRLLTWFDECRIEVCAVTLYIRISVLQQRLA